MELVEALAAMADQGAVLIDVTIPGLEAPLGGSSLIALDFKTDAALRRALRDSTSDSTILVVTQRVSTVKNAEQIVVLDQGRIVGKGTHAELMETCETYQEIALSQLSMEELSS